jgi:hypothetical protein
MTYLFFTHLYNPYKLYIDKQEERRAINPNVLLSSLSFYHLLSDILYHYLLSIELSF